MRTGDPHIASSMKTWTGTNKPFSSPVQRSLPELAAAEPKSVPPASDRGTYAAVLKNQHDAGDFNTGNGGKWPAEDPAF